MSKAVNQPDNVCGRYSICLQRRKIYEQVIRAYKIYCGREISDQDKSWRPHVICITCCTSLITWMNVKAKSMPFAVPMIWHEQSNHSSDCYFCLTNVIGKKAKDRSKIHYPDCKSALKPLPHDENPVPVSQHAWDIVVENSNGRLQDDHCYQEVEESKPQLLSQVDLDDLIRDLSLAREKFLTFAFDIQTTTMEPIQNIK